VPGTIDGGPGRKRWGGKGVRNRKASARVAGGANNSRLTSITVDDYWPQVFGYGDSGGLDDRISRV
jgi:hypothetical protein